MTIYKTKTSPNWYARVHLPDGTSIRKSTGTSDKHKAKEIVESWLTNYTDTYTVDDAIEKLLMLSEGQKNYKHKARQANYWLSVLKGRAISSLTSDIVHKHLPKHNLGNGKKGLPMANSTKNRYLAVIIRAILIAESSGWLSKPIKVMTYPESAENFRWITQDEAKRLIEHIHLPWLQDLVVFALATGCRQGEIFKLQWQNISFERNSAWIGQGDTKSSRSRPIPLNSTAMRLLEKRRLLHQQYCFCRSSGLKLTGIDRRVFDKALLKANIAPMSFHDLRHTWASWHVQNGTPLLILKELGGWETIEIVQRYAHLNSNHLTKYANASLFEGSSTI